MAEVFEQAMEVALDKKDQKRKKERRLERERKGESKKEDEGKSRPDEISKKDSAKRESVADSLSGPMAQSSFARKSKSVAGQARLELSEVRGRPCRAKPGNGVPRGRTRISSSG